MPKSNALGQFKARNGSSMYLHFGEREEEDEEEEIICLLFLL